MRYPRLLLIVLLAFIGYLLVTTNAFGQQFNENALFEPAFTHTPLVADDATEAFILRELASTYDDGKFNNEVKDGLLIRVYRPTGTCTGGVLTRVVVRVIITQPGPNDGNEYRAVLEGACLEYDPNSPNGTTVIWTDVEATPWAEELPDVNIDEMMPGTKRIFRVRVECRPIGGGPVTVIKRYVTISFVCRGRPNGPAFSPQLQRAQQTQLNNQ